MGYAQLLLPETEGDEMTTVQRCNTPMGVDADVYTPQADSYLLLSAMDKARITSGSRVLDLCTGSGVVAMNAATCGAREVIAVDIEPAAVRCAKAAAADAGLAIEVVHGGLVDALALAPFDVVLCNPPYVPSSDHEVQKDSLSSAWNAGRDGRRVLEPLCANMASLLTPGGIALIVHSEFAGITTSLRQLRNAGLTATVVKRKTIPFGPVMRSRARWLEMRGILDRGRRMEEIVVIRAQRGADGGDQAS
nr:HemK2/MTQ2 family protein methyltransferase [Rhodococcus sp. (in: high G+C Gram-positive bacteria)]